MAICLSSAGAILAFLQAAPPPSAPRAAAPPAESLAVLWNRVRADSATADAWLALGRAYLAVASGYHAHRDSVEARVDSAGARAALDTAEVALERAAAGGGATAVGDSAQRLRLAAVAARAHLAWELAGRKAAAQVWEGRSPDVRPPPVLEELGENLLRACPRGGVLLTAADADSYAAWYLQLGNGLRPDLLVLPLGVWRSDSVFRARVGVEEGVAPASGPGNAELQALAAKRALCASMGFAAAPDVTTRVRWSARPLVWVSGKATRGERVPPQDFVFAALRLALDGGASWTDSALALYRRAVASTPALCQALAVYGVREEVGCR